MVQYKDTQMGIITKLSEQNEVKSLTKEIPSGQSDQMDLPDKSEALLNEIEVPVDSRQQ